MSKEAQQEMDAFLDEQLYRCAITEAEAALARAMKGSAHAKEAAAFRELCMLVGAIVIARASDPKTARDVLAACKATA
jgi:hypothetical protein